MDMIITESLVEGNETNNNGHTVEFQRKRCLLCCKNSPVIELTNLKYLIRYLKIDIGKVVEDGDSFKVPLENLKENLEVEASLCSRCSQSIDSFYQLYYDLQEINLQLNSFVYEISKLVQDNSQKKDSGNELETEPVIKLNGVDLEGDIAAQKFRKETNQKCLDKLKSGYPKVLLKTPKLLEETFKLECKHESEESANINDDGPRIIKSQRLPVTSYPVIKNPEGFPNVTITPIFPANTHFLAANKSCIIPPKVKQPLSASVIPNIKKRRGRPIKTFMGIGNEVVKCKEVNQCDVKSIFQAKLNINSVKKHEKFELGDVAIKQPYFSSPLAKLINYFESENESSEDEEKFESVASLRYPVEQQEVKMPTLSLSAFAHSLIVKKPRGRSSATKPLTSKVKKRRGRPRKTLINNEDVKLIEQVNDSGVSKDIFQDKIAFKNIEVHKDEELKEGDVVIKQEPSYKSPLAKLINYFESDGEKSEDEDGKLKSSTPFTTAVEFQNVAIPTVPIIPHSLVVKKRRGRPLNLNRQEPFVMRPTETSSIVTPPISLIKKPRGRPRTKIHPISFVKRPVGRPRTKTRPISIVKRPVGRPRTKIRPISFVKKPKGRPPAINRPVLFPKRPRGRPRKTFNTNEGAKLIARVNLNGTTNTIQDELTFQIENMEVEESHVIDIPQVKLEINPIVTDDEFEVEDVVVKHERSYSPHVAGPINYFDIDIEKSKDEDECESMEIHTSKVIHANSRPYPCPHCDKSFGQHTGRRKHLLKVHTDAVFKPYFPNTSETVLNDEITSVLTNFECVDAFLKCRYCALTLDKSCHLKIHMLLKHFDAIVEHIGRELGVKVTNPKITDDLNPSEHSELELPGENFVGEGLQYVMIQKDVSDLNCGPNQIENNVVKLEPVYEDAFDSDTEKYNIDPLFELD